MVVVEIIERVTFSHGEDDDMIKSYEELGGGWRKVSNSTITATFECRKSAMFSSDDYRKGVMDDED